MGKSAIIDLVLKLLFLPQMQALFQSFELQVLPFVFEPQALLFAVDLQALFCCCC